MEDCSTDERLQQETLCRRQWTDEYIERPDTLMRQNVEDANIKNNSKTLIPAFDKKEKMPALFK